MVVAPAKQVIQKSTLLLVMSVNMVPDTVTKHPTILLLSITIALGFLNNWPPLPLRPVGYQQQYFKQMELQLRNTHRILCVDGLLTSYSC